MTLLPLKHRELAYAHLAGSGLEIGALHEPAKVGPACKVSYFDAVTESDAARLFPEIPSEKLVHVDYLGDLDRGGLAQFGNGSFDFVIANHVLEHVSNPIGAVRELFRIVKSDGCVLIAIPDKEYTFDRGRAPTPYAHLWQDYLNGTTESDDAHYEDFLRSAAPHIFSEPPENVRHHIARARERREHAHVWTSQTFREFLEETYARLQIPAELLFESRAIENQIEYSSVWRKTQHAAI